MTVLFATTAFLGASLMFVVEPMVARFVLPRFGGSATVWSTTSLFFQLVLLLGYLYVHLATTRLRRSTQIWLHLLVLAVPLLSLPVAAPGASAGRGRRPSGLLAVLAVMIGLPFAVLSTTGPLLQRWYSWTVSDVRTTRTSSSPPATSGASSASSRTPSSSRVP